MVGYTVGAFRHQLSFWLTLHGLVNTEPINLSIHNADVFCVMMNAGRYASNVLYKREHASYSLPVSQTRNKYLEHYEPYDRTWQIKQLNVQSYEFLGQLQRRTGEGGVLTLLFSPVQWTIAWLWVASPLRTKELLSRETFSGVDALRTRGTPMAGPPGSPL